MFLKIFSLLGCAFTLSSLQAADQVRLRPVAANYEWIVPTAVRRAPSVCDLALSPPPAPLAAVPGGVLVVGTKKPRNGSNDLWAIQLVDDIPRGTAPGHSVPYRLGIQSFNTDDLNNTSYAEHFTSNFFRALFKPERVAPGSSIVVSKDALVDTSLLIRYSDSRHFIIEQASDPEQLQRNLDWLRDRPFSKKLTIFDFSPKSSATLEQIGHSPAELPKWQEFSTNIDQSLEIAPSKDIRGEQTQKAFFERLEDPEGGMVLIYGHSDGTRIWMDTKEGLKTISSEDLHRRYGHSGRRLCPVILANCETRAALARVFLDAGCPFVATSDSPLRIDTIAEFVKSMTRYVHLDGMDVIDAYYAAQATGILNRMRPVASAGKIRVYVLRGYTSITIGS